MILSLLTFEGIKRTQLPSLRFVHLHFLQICKGTLGWIQLSHLKLELWHLKSLVGRPDGGSSSELVHIRSKLRSDLCRQSKNWAPQKLRWEVCRQLRNWAPQKLRWELCRQLWNWDHRSCAGSWGYGPGSAGLEISKALKISKSK